MTYEELRATIQSHEFRCTICGPNIYRCTKCISKMVSWLASHCDDGPAASVTPLHGNGKNQPRDGKLLPVKRVTV